MDEPRRGGAPRGGGHGAAAGGLVRLTYRAYDLTGGTLTWLVGLSLSFKASRLLEAQAQVPDLSWGPGGSYLPSASPG
jgi:hypothetical protein